MSFLARLFRPHVELPKALAARLDAWREWPLANERAPLDQARFVVVDVETSGLDPRRDRLLSIGAVVVEGRRLRPGEGYEATVRNDEPSTRDNILVHGIGPDAQSGGTAPDEALMGFLELARHDVLVAFHADFDRTVLDRALREQLGVRLPNLWLDLAWVAPSLIPNRRHRALDDWLAELGLRAHVRHSAASDAFVTAELLLILLHRAARHGLRTVGEILAASESHRRMMYGAGA